MRNDYLHDGGYRMELAVRKLDELPEPNRGYALAFKRKLDLEGKKERTIARRLHEVRHCLKMLSTKELKVRNGLTRAIYEYPDHDPSIMASAEARLLIDSGRLDSLSGETVNWLFKAAVVRQDKNLLALDYVQKLSTLSEEVRIAKLGLIVKGSDSNNVRMSKSAALALFMQRMSTTERSRRRPDGYNAFKDLRT